MIYLDNEIHEIISSLSSRRPVFHSEADFQHALAWELQEHFPQSEIRLEIPIDSQLGSIHLDLLAIIDGTTFGIELKYKTRYLEVLNNRERFSLKNQSAQDIGRYDFLVDIKRIEQLLLSQRCDCGYAILLTNDSSYWKKPLTDNTVDAAFRIQENRVIKGKLVWSPKASEGTTRNREAPIEINGNYHLKWKDYSNPSTASYGIFRYLMISIKSVEG